MSEETTARTEPPEATASTTSSGPFLSVLLGGVLAGGIGFLAAYYTEFGLFQTDDGSEALSEIAANLDAQAARLDAVEGQASAAEDTTAMDDVRNQIGAAGEQIADLAARLDQVGAAGEDAAPDLSGIEERLAALEARPEAPAPDRGQADALSALTERVAALSARLEDQAATIDAQAQTLDAQAQKLDAQSQTLDSQKSAITEAEQAAAREANRIAAQAALSEIRAAFESGIPFADAVGALQSASGTTVPEALSTPAGQGIATLAALQDSFAAAARDALAASVGETAGDNPIDRFGAFLKAQTGARSLSEKDGSGADAVLSRAEARLSEGDLTATLSEIQSLPQSGQDAMSDWTARARTRADAKAALADLAQSLNSN